MDSILCNPISPLYLIISQNVPSIVYYSHFLSIITSLVLILYVLKFGNNKLTNKIFTFTFLSFISWVVFALIFWASNRGDIIMLVWSLTLLVEPLTYIGSFYILYLLIDKKDLPYKYKVILFIIYLPLIVFVPTKFSLPGFDASTCLSIEGPIALYYTYFIEGLMIVLILGYSINKIVKNKEKRFEILSLSIGIILFLFAFAWGNIIGSVTEDWQLAQYGLFGMPIFAGFLVYSIIKFRTFNIKLITTQALVVVLWLALCAVLFIRTIENVRIIVSITLILFLIVGILLVRSVKREVEQREKIENLAKDLERANEKLRELDQMKSEFLSLATHQIRSPLTAIKGYSSMMLDGDYGEFPVKAKNAVRTIMTSSQNLINIVGEFLDISRIEQGRMVYNKETFDIGELVKETLNEIMPNIKKAGLEIETKIPENFSAKTNLDKGKTKQIISNLIDNAIKYTPKGSIGVSLENHGHKTVIKIKDTGIGIEEKDIDKLFTKFTRTKDAFKTNVFGTGLGLYVAKKMMEAQGGNIHVESEGLGKGSTFVIEIPRTL